MAEEERQQQRADVRAVDVGVGHDDDAVVAQLERVERVADAGAERRDQRPDLFEGEDLVFAGALDVQDLAPERQDGLEAPVAALLGRAAGRVALDEEQLAVARVLLGAVGQLAGQGQALERALADDQLARLAGGLAGAGGGQALLDDAPPVGRVFRQELVEAGVDHGLDGRADLGVVELVLGLALELRVEHLDADDRRQALAHVLAGQVGVQSLSKPVLRA